MQHLREQWRVAAQRSLSFYPAEDGRGKWHAADKITDTPLCGATTLLDTKTAPITVSSAEGAHPILCRICLRRGLTKEALPSWRPFNTPSTEHFWTDYDAVIATDKARPVGYDVYTYGQLVARRGSLADAQQYVQDVYGPLQWERVLMPKAMVHHYYFGLTDEFTDPTTIWVVRRLPKLGASDITIQQGTPLDYKGKFIGNPYRLSMIERGYDASAGDPDYAFKGNWEGSTAEMIGYLDVFVTKDVVYIGFMTTRRDRMRQGVASKLIARAYQNWPDHEFSWGLLADTGSEMLYHKYREIEPDRTFGGKVW